MSAEETCEDSHLDGIDFLPWTSDAEGPTCYITGLPNPAGDIEGEDNICGPCAAKWIYDYEGPEGEGYYRASAMNAESFNALSPICKRCGLSEAGSHQLDPTGETGICIICTFNQKMGLNAESEIVVPECLFCENDDTDEPLVEVLLDGYPELICESCMDPNNWAAESFGPVDEDGILAKALAKARAKSKEPRRPLKITKLPHRNQKSLKDFEEFNSAIVYQKPKGIIAQVMAKEKALQQLALSEAILELEQYIRLGMISEEDAFKKIVQMSR